MDSIACNFNTITYLCVVLINEQTNNNTKAVGSTEPTINISIAKLADCLVFCKF